MTASLTLLHTSDWHLGRHLYGRSRYTEFAAFLDWLLDTLHQQQVDVLLVAGDVFDTTTPSHRAQQLYYRFLARVAATGCRHVVVIGGNHDSPTLLNAPNSLLRHLDVHVLGSATAEPVDEVLLLGSREAPELIVCAVPYLRDRELRQVEAGESPDDKTHKLLQGIRQHYNRVTEAALTLRDSLLTPVPVVALGHLFACGGQVHADDGMRELYVGSLARIEASIFSSELAYVALGHLHSPQQISGPVPIHYCGAPLAMGFGEARQSKSVALVQLEGTNPATISALPVPIWQPLAQIQGDRSALTQQLQQLVEAGESCWVEALHTAPVADSQLRERLAALVEGSPVELLRVRQSHLQLPGLRPQQPYERLDELSTEDVFQRCLDAYQVNSSERDDLWQCYREILANLHHSDPLAE